MMMNKILEFLTLYYREIIDISVLIISVIICLIRKRPCINEMDRITKDVLEQLPIWIDMVEKDGHGAEKKSTVMSMAVLYVKKRYNVDVPDGLLTSIGEFIESILSTPTKKGENYGEKRK